MPAVLVVAIIVSALIQATPSPQIDSVSSEDTTQRLAFEHAKQGDVQPIPLGARGETDFGVAFDSFRLRVRATRAAAAAGQPLESFSPQQSELKLVIVAFPLQIEGRVRLPYAIELLNRNREPVVKLEDAEGDAVGRFTYGASLPSGAIASRFNSSGLRPAELVRIAYRDDAGNAVERPIDLPVQIAMPTKIRDVQPQFPPGQPPPREPITVVVSLTIDLNGRPRFAHVIGGPATHAAGALAAAEQWLFEPARVNGAPVVSAATITVTYSMPK